MITRNVPEHLNLLINDARFTFSQYPFRIETPYNFENCARIPDLLSLAAMKAYALGIKSKWKDYLSLYFILHNGLTIEETSNKANQIFRSTFFEKMFRIQLSFFDDVDYSEELVCMNENIEDKEVKTI